MVFFTIMLPYLRNLIIRNMTFSFRLILSFILGLAVHLSEAQVNKVDDQGRRQGPWKKFHDGTRIIRYAGEFTNDVPVGTFKYFYENGKVFSVNIFRGATGVCYSKQYSGSGNVIAEGVYRYQKKDSVWTYYDRDFNVMSTETYKIGELHGESKTFFPNGNVLELLNFESNKRQGKYVEYYENGQVYIKSAYKNDKMHGEMRIYTYNGKKRAEGAYVEGEKHEKWIWFNEQGRPERIEEYRYGQLMKEREVE